MIVIKDNFGIYYLNKQDQYHREDGPALEFDDGTKKWFINGLRHRTGGPAIEWSNGDKTYFLVGKNYSYENWLAVKDYPLLW